MYKCKVCGNDIKFEEINVVKTYIDQKDKTNSGTDEFFYREDVVCLNCGNNLDDGHIEEI